MDLPERIAVTIAVFGGVECCSGGDFVGARITKEPDITRHLGQHVEETDRRCGNAGFILYSGHDSTPAIEVARFSGESGTACHQDKKQNGDNAIHGRTSYLNGVQIT